MVNIRFNNYTDRTLLGWMRSGTSDQQLAAVWLSNEIRVIYSTGQLSTSVKCLSRLNNILAHHISRRPCNLLLRTKKIATLQLNITFDDAINGNKNWKKLATFILTQPNGP